jgi:hypothetical protein
MATDGVHETPRTEILFGLGCLAGVTRAAAQRPPRGILELLFPT